MSHHPEGGHLNRFRKNWERITQDNWTLHMIQGLKFEVVSTLPHQVIHQTQLDSKKAQVLSDKVNKLFQKKAIVPAIKDGPGFVSPVFVLPKAGDQCRPVINLKALNHFVIAPHFKMESIKTVKYPICKDDWLTKPDLKDAYLSVQVNPCYQKYLKFHWPNQLWQFTVYLIFLPN